MIQSRATALGSGPALSMIENRRQMYVIVFPGGITGFDWVWLGLGLFADIVWWSGAAVGFYVVLTVAFIIQPLMQVRRSH